VLPRAQAAGGVDVSALARRMPRRFPSVPPSTGTVPVAVVRDVLGRAEGRQHDDDEERDGPARTLLMLGS
jgi:hypothetical protein